MIKKKIKKKDNIINFPTKLSSIEKEIEGIVFAAAEPLDICLLYTSPSPRDNTTSRMPSSA